MASIELDSLYKVFGPPEEIEKALSMHRDGESTEDIHQNTGCTMAVADATFTVEGPEIFVIMGLSGSGKSTLLRCVNRLIEPTAGSVKIDDQDIIALGQDELLALRKEKVAMVFQHFGLLPHRTVLENAAFALELQQVPLAERTDKAMEALELVGLTDYADSRVDELSGGMQQRVGLARALATDADILLMDEAFSALDPLIRTQMQAELLELQEQMPKTILFITHDLAEALALGDRIAIMKAGAIVQIGGPEEILTDPANEYVSSFVENVDRSRVLTVATAMAGEAPTVGESDSLEQAVEVMERHDAAHVFVLKDSGEPSTITGVVDLHKALREMCTSDPKLANVIEEAPEPIEPDSQLIDILVRSSRTIGPLPVLDEEGNIVGALHREQILRAIAGREA
jgi:glycine betaine/proline transport system ATP-binding protein